MMDRGFSRGGPANWQPWAGTPDNYKLSIAALVQNGTVRVLDLVLITKDDAGSFDAFEMADIDESLLGELRELERELADLLSVDDVAQVAQAMDSGSTAALLVYENLWAAPFASAVRRAGGQLVANGRIPVQALLAALEDRSEAAVTAGNEQGA